MLSSFNVGTLQHFPAFLVSPVLLAQLHIGSLSLVFEWMSSCLDCGIAGHGSHAFTHNFCLIIDGHRIITSTFRAKELLLHRNTVLLLLFFLGHHIIIFLEELNCTPIAIYAMLSSIYKLFEGQSLSILV